mgnify:CR=1 FL=1
MSRKKTHEEYIADLKEKNPEFECLEQYQGNTIKILHKHLVCGYEWKRTPKDMLRGHGCPKCNGKLARTNDEFKEIPKNTVENVDNSTSNLVEEIEVKEADIKTSENKTQIGQVQQGEEIKKEILYKYVGNIFNTYIIIQIEDKMYVIDQHAAHERLLFEEFKESYYSTDRNIQMMLIPTLVELTPKEKNIVVENMSMFEKAGFILEEFDEKTIKISGIPNIGYDIDYTGMFKDIIDEILGVVKTEKEEKEHRFLATLACKAAVKGNMKLDVQEQINLIDKMVKLENPFTCPHGRPTAFEMSRYEIERKFLRK